MLRRMRIRRLYLSLREGYGTGYERYAFDKFASKMVREYDISKVLELPADGIMGIPGIKSLIFAELGCNVTVAHPSKRLLLDARRLWAALGLEASFITTHYLVSGFKDDAFDLVWNFCVIEHVSDARSMIREMLRVTRRYVLLEMQNVFNIGLPLHRLYHLLRKEPWDHGELTKMRLSYVRRLFEREGGRVVEVGATDMPPWPDINIRLREAQSQTIAASKQDADSASSELRPNVKLRPVTEVIDELRRTSAPASTAAPTFAERLFDIWYEFVESKVPTPLKILLAHHPYLIAEKCR
ncbi:MAG: hypothetical protein DRN91_02085 [Candidatus Alkanophagales archaeon]|nr:MAG: hypothetical protein DRN91_02085 [Candidatus Alkanophagales archaeon]